MALTKVIGSGIGSFELTEDTASGNNASIGFTATEGLILTGQGSTNDITIKNDADTAILNVATGTTTASFPGQVSSAVGQSMIPEFISNLYLAGNSATSADLQGCFTSTYSVYRIIGVIGGAHGSEANVYFQLYTSTNTTVDGNWYGAGRNLDDAQAEANVAIAANDVMIINARQSSTGFGLLDMHLYMQPSATVISGNTSLHDQGGDRGFYIFNAKNAGSTAPTGFKISHSESGNMSASNLSVYGYRIRQNATTKMTGSYS